MESLLESIPYSTPLLKITALIVLAVIIKLLLKILKLFLQHSTIKQNKILYHIQDITALVCGVFFLIITAIVFATEIKEFAIPFSVIGAGIAFSLQEVIASIAGRIIIVTTGLFQVGDRIQVGEIQGDVISIGFMRTSLMEIGNWVKADQHSGRIIHLTNAIILKESVVNYSGAFPFVWDEIVVPVRYGSDQHAARQILLNIVEPIVSPFKTMANEKWLDVKDRYMIDTSNFDPAVTLIANDNWLEFTARYLVPHTARRNIKDKLFQNIVDAFSQTDGKVEFASMTIEITNFPKLAVDVSQSNMAPGEIIDEPAVNKDD
ncbi:MAG: mechanosensitive ion channel [Gammaproteobacteria bacterium]|nr:mechanosensitive ion channel [Gammaproteobacteria bacterium]